jgi:hypothetical protein
MEPFAAAAAAVWMHGDAAAGSGRLVSGDRQALAAVLRELSRR